MTSSGPHLNGRERPRSEQTPSTDSELEESDARASRWRPGVRLVLALVVLLPLVSAAILITSSATGAWKARQHAQVAAADASTLQTVAAARAEMNSLEVPLSAVSYAAGLGVNESELDALLHAKTPFSQQLATDTSTIAEFPTFNSTPTLRADVKRLRALIAAEALTNNLPYSMVQRFETKMAADIDASGTATTTRCRPTSPPGSRRAPSRCTPPPCARPTTPSSPAGARSGRDLRARGTRAGERRQALIQAAGEYQTATPQFVGHLGPSASRRGTTCRPTRPTDSSPRRSPGGEHRPHQRQPPFAGNLDFAGSSMTPGLQYLADLNQLVTASSQDLRAHGPRPGVGGRPTGCSPRCSSSGVLALVCLAGVALVGCDADPPPRAPGRGRPARSTTVTSTSSRLPPRGPPGGRRHDGRLQRHGLHPEGGRSQAVALAAEDLSASRAAHATAGPDGSCLAGVGRHAGGPDPRARAPARPAARGGDPRQL